MPGHQYKNIFKHIKNKELITFANFYLGMT